MIRLAKLLSLVVLITLSSCFEEDVYSDVPRIEFRDLKFFDGANTDSLLLTFYFEDGGADIGFEGNELIARYYLYVDAQGTIVTEDNLLLTNPPYYTAPLLFDQFQPIIRQGNSVTIRSRPNTFPMFISDTVFYSDDTDDIPFECPGIINQNGNLFDTINVVTYRTILEPPLSDSINFSYAEVGVTDVEGQVPAILNERFYNMILRFERKVGSDYEQIIFREEFGSEDCETGLILECSRIPLFTSDGRSGTITYKMQSLLLRLGLQDDVFRIRFYVYDGDGNKSNEVLTPDFILSEITQ